MNDIICAVDTETNSVNLLTVEAVQVCLYPLDDNFNKHPEIPPLSFYINPGKQALDDGHEALAFNKIGRDYLEEFGMLPQDVYGFIKGWMHSFRVKQLIPLAHNWVFDRIVMARLLGNKNCEDVFFRRAKDSHSLAVAINDLYKINSLPIPFKSTRLGDLAKHFGMDNTGAHEALKDCEMCAFVYKKLLDMLTINKS